MATVVLTIFSVGYIEMARRVTAAGGFYSFMSHGFGQVPGLGTAMTITLCYVIFTGSVTGVTSYFANTTIADWLGPSTSRSGSSRRAASALMACSRSSTSS